MPFAPLTKVKSKLSAYIAQCEAEGPIVITRNGKPVAVMIATHNDEEVERLIVAHSPRLQALLDKSRQSIKAGKGLKSVDFWRTVKRRRAKAK